MKKELIFYGVILTILIIITIFNNMFWKIGKENSINYLEYNNITYDVPFDEKVLD